MNPLSFSKKPPRRDFIGLHGLYGIPFFAEQPASKAVPASTA
jgi:hypothetical protein